MSIRHSILSFLRHGPMHGYQLRTAFDQLTNSSKALNIGQVYTTLTRLSRDGLVEALPAGDNRQQPFALTAAGERESAEWFLRPLSAVEQPRDELALKIALAVSTPGINVREVIQQQRSATMRELQEHTRLALHAGTSGELGWRLLLERLLSELDAQLRWLDRCEDILHDHPPAPLPGPSAPTSEPMPGTAARLAGSAG